MSEQTSFKPSLGLLDATMVVAGSMIGSGIFIVSADIVRNVGTNNKNTGTDHGTGHYHGCVQQS